jgi:hypothetical protein
MFAQSSHAAMTGRCEIRIAAITLACLVGLPAWAAEPAAAPGDRPGSFAVKKTATGGALVQLDGEPIAEYFVDRGNTPFLWRIIGPTGKSMTRGFPLVDVEGETTDHVHQRGLLFGHQGVAGFDTWTEAATYRDNPKYAERLATLGAIRHQGYRTLTGGTTAMIHAHNEILDASNKPLLNEERRMTFSAAAGARIIDVDVDLVAAHGPVEMADMKDAGVYIRVPDSMAVDRRLGGTIVNSAGQRDADAWSRTATWVDYHGPVEMADMKDAGVYIRVPDSMAVDRRLGGTIVNSAGQRDADSWSRTATWVDYHGPVEGDHLGIAILNHPTSFRHPTAWHVRTYGLFCANPFGMKQMNPEAESGAVSLPAGGRISLRHRFIFHVGDEQQAGIAEAYDTYAATTPAPLGP